MTEALDEQPSVVTETRKGVPMSDNATCLFCDHALDGQSKLFCTTCLPRCRDWDDKRQYMRRYAELHAAVGRSDTGANKYDLPPSRRSANVQQIPNVSILPRSHPARQDPPRKCVVCGSDVPRRNRHSCSTACRKIRAAETSRARHQERVTADEVYRAQRRAAKYKRKLLAAKAFVELFEHGVPGDGYSRIDIAQRDDWTCQLCGKEIEANRVHPDPACFTIDHIIPISRGGADVATNVQSAHLSCNSSKSDGVHGNGEQMRLMMF